MEVVHLRRAPETGRRPFTNSSGCPVPPESSSLVEPTTETSAFPPNVVSGPGRTGVTRTAFVLNEVPEDSSRRFMRLVLHVDWKFSTEEELEEILDVFPEVASKVGPPTRRCRQRPPAPGEKQTSLDLCSCNKYGRSHVIGCSLAPHSDRCKFSRTRFLPHKTFGNKNLAQENVELGVKAERLAGKLADRVGCRILSSYPEHSAAMESRGRRSRECRLGTKHHHFSGVSICAGFVAHCHTDFKDVKDGLSAVITAIPDPRGEKQFHAFPTLSLQDSELEGLAVLLPHGSLALESSRHFLHQTSKFSGKPFGKSPPRVALVFFLHAGLDLPLHGAEKG